RRLEQNALLLQRIDLPLMAGLLVAAQIEQFNYHSHQGKDDPASDTCTRRGLQAVFDTKQILGGGSPSRRPSHRCRAPYRPVPGSVAGRRTAPCATLRSADAGQWNVRWNLPHRYAATASPHPRDAHLSTTEAHNA